MVGTALSVVIGIVATIAVGNYYFRRTVNKSLGVYGLLNSYVFAGIASDVRQQLHFRFQERDVHELQQLVFLVANDGEKAIRDVIQPLCLTVPPEVEVLDAMIVHRRPDALSVDLVLKNTPSGGTDMAFHFPLLNKGEYFVAKLLLSGQLRIDAVRFSILAEDLPRSLGVKAVSPATVRERSGYRFEWALAGMGVLILLFALWICRTLYVVWALNPTVFPVPWNSYHVTTDSVLLIVPAILALPVLGILVVLLCGAAVFGGEFPPSRAPHFPLPQELADAVSPYGWGSDMTLKASGWSDPFKESHVKLDPSSAEANTPKKASAKD